MWRVRGLRDSPDTRASRPPTERGSLLEPCSVGANEAREQDTGGASEKSRVIGLPIEASAIGEGGFQQFSEFLSGALAKGILGNKSAWTFIEGLLDSNFVVCVWILLSGYS